MKSKYFTVKEIQCKCGICEQAIVDDKLLNIMEDIRSIFEKPVIVHSWNRCKDHNESIGGVPESQHVKGKACDFHIKNTKMKEVHQVMLELYENGVVNNMGLYDTFVHVDTREGRHFWDKRSG